MPTSSRPTWKRVSASVLVADIAYDAERDPALVAIPAGHLFGSQITHLAIKRGATLRTYVHHFIALVAPDADAAMIDRLVRGEGHDPGGDYQL